MCVRFSAQTSSSGRRFCTLQSGRSPCMRQMHGRRGTEDTGHRHGSLRRVDSTTCPTLEYSTARAATVTDQLSPRARHAGKETRAHASGACTDQSQPRAEGCTEFFKHDICTSSRYDWTVHGRRHYSEAKKYKGGLDIGRQTRYLQVVFYERVLPAALLNRHGSSPSSQAGAEGAGASPFEVSGIVLERSGAEG